jgi:hypothetical protein
MTTYYYALTIHIITKIDVYSLNFYENEQFFKPRYAFQEFNKPEICS